MLLCVENVHLIVIEKKKDICAHVPDRVPRLCSYSYTWLGTLPLARLAVPQLHLDEALLLDYLNM